MPNWIYYLNSVLIKKDTHFRLVDLQSGAHKQGVYKYCVFFKDFKIFRTPAFLCFVLESMCVRTPGR